MIYKRKIVYKVFAVEDGELRSIWIKIAKKKGYLRRKVIDAFYLTYRAGERTQPKIGKVYCFETFKQALGWARWLEEDYYVDFEVWRCRATQVDTYPRVLCPNLAGLDRHLHLAINNTSRLDQHRVQISGALSARTLTPLNEVLL
jgi:hypothetical protein